jgi:hypothetical protein
MKIQKRDEAILGIILKYGLLSSEQIRELHFKNLHHTTLMRRLRTLEKEKLILRMDSLPNNQSAWSLGILGARILKADPPGRFTNRNTTLHDVTVSGIRMSLESVGLCQNFSSEMEMKRQINYRLDEKKSFLQVPDGLFMVRVKNKDLDQAVAMEVELHPKNHARYRKIIGHYLEKDSIKYVWYFVKSIGIAQTIHSQWKVMRKKNPETIFLFSLIEEANADASKLKAHTTVKGDWVAIQDIFDLPRLNEKSENETASPIGKEDESSLGKQAA